MRKNKLHTLGLMGKIKVMPVSQSIFLDQTRTFQPLCNGLSLVWYNYANCPCGQSSKQPFSFTFAILQCSSGQLNPSDNNWALC